MKNNNIFIFCFIFFLCTALLNAQEKTEILDFEKHKVKKKETLYGLSKQYNVPIDSIIAYNPKLKRKGLKKRMVLKIPIYKEKGFIYHKVLTKETKWSISQKYNTSIETLEEKNPKIIGGLKVGDLLRVPEIDTIIIDPKYKEYVVKPKEGFYRIKINTGLTEEQLKKHNPKLDSLGLQVGMVLKIPIEKDSLMDPYSISLPPLIDLSSLSRKKDTVNIAVFLPFKIEELKNTLKSGNLVLKERNLHTISLEFYSGLRWAFVKAKELGININAKIYDTQNSTWVIDKILNSNNFDNIDVIIGPLIPTNFNFLASKSTETAIVFPLSTMGIEMQPNVFQSVIQEEFLRKKSLSFLTKKLNKKQDSILILHDTNHVDIRDELLATIDSTAFYDIEEYKFLHPQNIDTIVSKVKNTKIILETEKLSYISSIVSLLSSSHKKNDSVNIQLLTTYRDPVYENNSISNKDLSEINFTFLSGFKTDIKKENSRFYKEYFNFYGYNPTKESIRGYDLALDIILRVSVAGSLKKSTVLGTTKYIENKFFYVEKEEGGFENIAYYILKNNEFWFEELNSF